MGPFRMSFLQKLNNPARPLLHNSKNSALNFNVRTALKGISENRADIPDRYWDDSTLRICKESVAMERGKDMETEFTMEGKTGDVCRMKVTADNYSDVHECGGEEFSGYMAQIRLSDFEAKKLKELYILSKKNPSLGDLLHCENMEIRRDAIKKMGFEGVIEHGTIINEFDGYVLFDLKYDGEDFGRFLKMIDSTSTEVYLLQVPRTRDFGTIKIPMNEAMQAVAWSFEKQKHNYHPEVET